MQEPTPQTPAEIITPMQAADRTHASLSQVYRWAREPGCPVLRLGRRKGVRFLWPDLLHWLVNRSQPRPRVEPVRQVAGGTPVPIRSTGRMSRLERAIREGRVRV